MKKYLIHVVVGVLLIALGAVFFNLPTSSQNIVPTEPSDISHYQNEVQDFDDLSLDEQQEIITELENELQFLDEVSLEDLEESLLLIQ